MDTVGVGAANGLVIRDQGKIFSRRRWSNSIIPCIRESNDPVAWRCAREVAAVLHIGPFRYYFFPIILLLPLYVSSYGGAK